MKKRDRLLNAVKSLKQAFQDLRRDTALVPVLTGVKIGKKATVIAGIALTIIDETPVSEAEAAVLQSIADNTFKGGERGLIDFNASFMLRLIEPARKYLSAHLFELKADLNQLTDSDEYLMGIMLMTNAMNEFGEEAVEIVKAKILEATMPDMTDRIMHQIKNGERNDLIVMPSIDE